MNPDNNSFKKNYAINKNLGYNILKNKENRFNVDTTIRKTYNKILKESSDNQLKRNTAINKDFGTTISKDSNNSNQINLDEVIRKNFNKKEFPAENDPNELNRKIQESYNKQQEPATITVPNYEDPENNYTVQQGVQDVTRGEIRVSTKEYPPPPLTEPRDLQGTITPYTATLQWIEPEYNGYRQGEGEFTGYIVERSTDQITWTPTVIVGNITNATITGLVNAIQYYFRVKATTLKQPAGGPYSSIIAPTPLPPLSEPRNFQGTMLPTSVSLQWVAPLNLGGATLTGYIIERSTDQITWTATTVGVVTTTTISGLTNSIQYYFRIKARTVDFPSGGPYSTTIAPTPLYAPSQPQNLSVAQNDRKLGLTWDAPSTDGGSAITSYKIQHSTDNVNWVDSSVITSFPPNVGFTGTLLNGTNYYVRIRAQNVIGPSSYVSAGPVKPNLLLTITPASVSGIKQASAPNLEFIEFYNPHPYDGDLTGWYLVSHENPPACNIGSPIQQYNFPTNATIPAGSYIRVYSGSAANPAIPFFWANAFIWFDGGDIADLYDYQNRWIDTMLTGDCLKDVAGYQINYTAGAGWSVTSIPNFVSEPGFTGSSLSRGAGMTNGDALTDGWSMRETLPQNSTLASALASNETIDFNVNNASGLPYEINGIADLRVRRQTNGPTRLALIFNKDNDWSSYTTIFDAPLAVSPAVNDLADTSIVGFKNNPITLNDADTGYFRFVLYAASGVSTTRNFNFSNQDMYLQVFTPFNPPA